jgi:hypothetical protein
VSPISIDIMHSGFELFFATTVHGIEGATVKRLIANLNYSPTFPSGIDLKALYVICSRVKAADHFRVTPWHNDQSSSYLLNLSHKSNVMELLNCYKKNGDFDIKKLPAKKDTTIVKSKKNINKVADKITNKKLAGKKMLKAVKNASVSVTDVIIPPSVSSSSTFDTLFHTNISFNNDDGNIISDFHQINWNFSEGYSKDNKVKFKLHFDDQYKDIVSIDCDNNEKVRSLNFTDNFSSFINELDDNICRINNQNNMNPLPEDIAMIELLIRNFLTASSFIIYSRQSNDLTQCSANTVGNGLCGFYASFQLYQRYHALLERKYQNNINDYNQLAISCQPSEYFIRNSHDEFLVYLRERKNAIEQMIVSDSNILQQIFNLKDVMLDHIEAITDWIYKQLELAECYGRDMFRDDNPPFFSDTNYWFDYAYYTSGWWTGTNIKHATVLYPNYTPDEYGIVFDTNITEIPVIQNNKKKFSEIIEIAKSPIFINYLNNNHFGLEPIVSDTEEIKRVTEAFDNLILNIMEKMLHYIAYKKQNTFIFK